MRHNSEEAVAHYFFLGLAMVCGYFNTVMQLKTGIVSSYSIGCVILPYHRPPISKLPPRT